jgi:hypothetical protein
MKNNPQFVMGHQAPSYHAKIPRDSWTLRLLWFLWRRYCLNEDYYRVTRRFTGPRPRGTNQASTIKANATAFRYYIEPRQRRPWELRL